MATATLPAPAHAVLDRVHEARESRGERYRRLVVAVARGDNKSDPDDALGVCEAVGKSEHDLQEDAERYLRRETAANRFAEVPKFKARGSELAAAEAKLRAEYDQFLKDYDRRFAELRNEQTNVVAEVVGREAEYRREFHPDVCPNPDAAEAYQRALAHRMELITHRAFNFENLQANRAALAASVEREESAGAQAALRARVERDEATVRELDARILDATAAVERALAETLKP